MYKSTSVPVHLDPKTVAGETRGRAGWNWLLL